MMNIYNFFVQNLKQFDYFLDTAYFLRISCVILSVISIFQRLPRYIRLALRRRLSQELICGKTRVGLR